MFIIGHLYTKKDIYEILKVPIAEQKGIWDTGYRLYNDEIFIFVNRLQPQKANDERHLLSFFFIESTAREKRKFSTNSMISPPIFILIPLFFCR